MTIGVLAVQGDVPEHAKAAARAAAPDKVVLVRGPSDLEGLDALLMPGGESTAIARLLNRTQLFSALSERVRSGLPTLGTCAGLILLAKRLAPGGGGQDPPTLGILDVTVRRNDYGRQRESFEGPVKVAALSSEFPGVFIRAPRIVELGPDAVPIAWREDEIVGVASGPIWGLTFHPELSGDNRLLEAFLHETGVRDRKTRRSNTAARTRPVPGATASQ